MREVLRIAFNDLRMMLRERGTLINIFVIPVFITVLLGVVNSSNASGGTIDVIRLDTKDPAAQNFVTLLKAEAGTRFTVCDVMDTATLPGGCKWDSAQTASRTTSEQRVKDNKTSAALVIPASFGADLGAGKQTTLEFIVQNGLNAPALIQQKIDAVLTRLNGTVAAARAVVAQVKPPADQSAALYGKVYTAAETIWNSNPVKITDISTTGTDAAGGTGFGQSSPGFGAMFVLIEAVGLGVVFVTERQTWTLQRLMMMPIARWQLLAGKLVGRYILCLVIFTTLILVGTLFGTQWGNLLGVALTVLIYSLAAVAIALAVSTFVRTRSQAGTAGILVGLTLAPLGGAWWPLSITPQWMQVIGHISPVAWSQDAFNKLVFYGGTVIDILPYLGVLLIYVVVFFAIGMRRFRYVD